jgi:phage-related protein
MIASLISSLLSTVSGGVTTFVTGVFSSVGSLLSDRRLKSDIVAVSWSQ